MVWGSLPKAPVSPLGTKEPGLCLSCLGAWWGGERMGDGSLAHKQGEVSPEVCTKTVSKCSCCSDTTNVCPLALVTLPCLGSSVTQPCTSCSVALPGRDVRSTFSNTSMTPACLHSPETSPLLIHPPSSSMAGCRAARPTLSNLPLPYPPPLSPLTSRKHLLPLL